MRWERHIVYAQLKDTTILRCSRNMAKMEGHWLLSKNLDEQCGSLSNSSCTCQKQWSKLFSNENDHFMFKEEGKKQLTCRGGCCKHFGSTEEEGDCAFRWVCENTEQRNPLTLSHPGDTPGTTVPKETNANHMPHIFQWGHKYKHQCLPAFLMCKHIQFQGEHLENEKAVVKLNDNN